MLRFIGWNWSIFGRQHWGSQQKNFRNLGQRWTFEHSNIYSQSGEGEVKRDETDLVESQFGEDERGGKDLEIIAEEEYFLCHFLS